MTTVPALELRSSYLGQKQKIDEAVFAVLDSGQYIGGSAVTEFEANFASYCGAEQCVSVGNGLDALHLALRSHGIGSGDEVITASNSYIATLLAITMAGATPVLVEPDPVTFTLDPARIRLAVTERTKAILPTHLYGHPSDLDPIIELCRAHSLALIEDAAQAHGAKYKGRRVGGDGNIVCWSFYPTKNLGAFGDGGAITTNDKALAETIRRLANYGQSDRYHNAIKGVNSRLDPVQAAILSIKLQRLDAANARRATIAARYTAGLSGLPVALPAVMPWASPVWHQYVILSDQRDALQAALAERGVGSLIHYPVPPHLQPAYSDLGFGEGSFPIAERIARQCLSLPLWADMADEMVNAVIDGVRGAAADLAA